MQAIELSGADRLEKERLFAGFMQIAAGNTAKFRDDLRLFLQDGLKENPVHFGMLAQELVAVAGYNDLIVDNVLTAYVDALQTLYNAERYDALYELLRALVALPPAAAASVSAAITDAMAALFRSMLRASEFCFTETPALSFTRVLHALFESKSHFFPAFLALYRDECVAISQDLFTDPALMSPSNALYENRALFWKFYYRSATYTGEHVLLTPYTQALEIIEGVARKKTLQEADEATITQTLAVLTHYFNRLVPVLILEMAERYPENTKLIELLTEKAHEASGDGLDAWNEQSLERVRVLKFQLQLCTRLTEYGLRTSEKMLVLVGKYSLPYILMHFEGMLEHLDDILLVVGYKANEE